MQTVQMWMTSNPITIARDASIIEAIHLMKEKNVRRLPVTCQGKFCGLITDRMIKDYSPGKASALDTWEVHYVLSKTTVQEAMNPNPYTVRPEAPLCEAAQIVHDHKLYGICVTNEKGDLVGLLTTTNFMEALVAICSMI
jgi:acetoin utilization protein AcuB